MSNFQNISGVRVYEYNVDKEDYAKNKFDCFGIKLMKLLTAGYLV